MDTTGPGEEEEGEQVEGEGEHVEGEGEVYEELQHPHDVVHPHHYGDHSTSSLHTSLRQRPGRGYDEAPVMDTYTQEFVEEYDDRVEPKRPNLVWSVMLCLGLLCLLLLLWPLVAHPHQPVHHH
jgi:hypothetical protein